MRRRLHSPDLLRSQGRGPGTLAYLYCWGPTAGVPPYPPRRSPRGASAAAADRRPSASPRPSRRACTVAGGWAWAKASGNSGRSSRVTGWARNDWRRSARSDRDLRPRDRVGGRQTVALWRDGSASMRWRSRGAAGSRRSRARNCSCSRWRRWCYAAANGCGLIGSDQRAGGGRAALDRLAAALPRLGDGGACRPVRLPRRGAWCCPEIGWRWGRKSKSGRAARLAAGRGRLGAGAGSGGSGAALRRAGPVQWAGARADALVPRVEGVRAAYAEVLERQQQGLAAICGAAGYGFAVHRTDQPPEATLLALYTTLAGM